MKPSAKEFARNAFQFVGKTYEEMDCQKFIEKAMKTVGINMDLAGSNTWYREMDWVGTPEECKRVFGCVPDGAILYILEHDGKEPARYKKDGKGNASHMGIVTNTGQGALHSSSKRGGVCESQFKGKTIPNGGWNRVGLSNMFDYGFEIEIGGKTMRDYFVAGGVVTAPIHMRKSPSTSAVIIAEIPQHSSVYFLSETDGWAKVIYDGHTGFVKKEFLLSTEAGTVDETFTDPVSPSVRDKIEEIARMAKDLGEKTEELLNEIGRG